MIIRRQTLSSIILCLAVLCAPFCLCAAAQEPGPASSLPVLMAAVEQDETWQATKQVIQTLATRERPTPELWRDAQPLERILRRIEAISMRLEARIERGQNAADDIRTLRQTFRQIHTRPSPRGPGPAPHRTSAQTAWA